jgi:hypothetical protein
MEANFKTCLWHQSFFTSSFAAPMAVPDEDGAVKALLPRLVEEFGQDWGKNLEYQWVYTALGLNRGRKFPSASVRSLTNVLVDKLQEQYPGTSWEDVVPGNAAPATSASSGSATALPPSKSIDIQYGWAELIGNDFSSAQEEVQPQGIWGDVLMRYPARVAQGKAATLGLGTKPECKCMLVLTSLEDL